MNAKSNAQPDAYTVLTEHLDAQERVAWDRRLAEQPEEAQAFAELEASWAALGLLAPQEVAPAGAFNAVLAQLPESKPRSFVPWAYALGGLAAGVTFMGLLWPAIESGKSASVAVEQVAVVEPLPAGAESGLRNPGDTLREDLVALEASLKSQAQTMQALTDENAQLREILAVADADRQALERQLRVQAQRWASFYDDSLGVARWSVLSMGSGGAEEPMTLVSRLDQLNATTPGGAQFSGAVSGVGGLSPQSVDATSNASALVLWDASNQEGLLSISGLVDAPEGSTYQMWVKPADSDAAPISAGLLPEFDNGAGQAVFNLTGENADVVEAFITVEPAGGSDTPTGPIILNGPVAQKASE